MRGSVAATIADFAKTTLTRARGLGIPIKASLSTVEEGDDAAEWRLGSSEETSMADEIRTYAGAASLMIDFNVIGRDSHGEPFTIDGVPLLIWVERPDLSAPPLPEPSELEFTIMLDVDLFAARSLATNRDNRQLAAINAPRFNEFLANLCADLNATIVGVDAPDYEGEVTIDGFTAGR